MWQRPSRVAKGCLTRRLREMKVGEDIVGWARSFMEERKVRMVINGKEEEEMEIITGLPQGSSVSPILFIIYINGVHEARERGGGVRSLSFVDDVTWITHRRSVRDQDQAGRSSKSSGLSAEERGPVRADQDGGDPFLEKPKKERSSETITIGSHQMTFNVKATRWLGILLDFRLRFNEHASRSAQRARAAEKILSSLVTRHGVPSIAARHLKDAIVGSTLMYGAEVTWRGQVGMRKTFQKSINRMTRASLGALPSTLVTFLQTEGGSLPALARLEKRQGDFAIRLASAPDGLHLDILRGWTRIGERLLEALGPEVGKVEKIAISQGRVFPGSVEIPLALG